MDTLAHGLWGGVAFGGRENATQWRWAFGLGVAPDLLSFGTFFFQRIGDIGERLNGGRWGPPDLSTIPHYVFQAYNVTHSLIVWAAIFGLVWALRRRPFWPLAAWGLHILCDIPTHSTRFFPTPYLWPFPTLFVEGMPWGRPWFMLTNYGLLAAVYALRRALNKMASFRA